MKRLHVALLMVVVVSIAGGAFALRAQSTAPTCLSQPLGLASGFNGLVFGNYSGARDASGNLLSGSDVEGRLAVGGNLTVKDFGVGSRLPSSFYTQDVLIVGGDINYTRGQVYGNVVYGGNLVWAPGTNQLGTKRRDYALDFVAARPALTALSANLRARPANGTTSVQYFGGPTAQISFTGTNAQLNIFNVAGSDMQRANSVSITVPAGATAAINISGTSGRMSQFGFTLNGASRSRIIYNFADATSLTLSNIGIQGSLLAPNANITFSNGNIWGQLIGNSFTGQGELELAPFDGCLPPAGPTPTPGPLGSIGDTVWVDTNGNRRQDGGEAGRGGVIVRLHWDDGDGVYEPGCDDVLLNTMQTDGQGRYLFTGLTADNYWVSIKIAQQQITTQHPMLVHLAAGQSFLDADFGLRPGAQAATLMAVALREQTDGGNQTC